MSWKCSGCNSTHVTRYGMVVTRTGRKPRVKCQNCGRTYYENTVRVVPKAAPVAKSKGR